MKKEKRRSIFEDIRKEERKKVCLFGFLVLGGTVAGVAGIPLAAYGAVQWIIGIPNWHFFAGASLVTIAFFLLAVARLKGHSDD